MTDEEMLREFLGVPPPPVKGKKAAAPVVTLVPKVEPKPEPPPEPEAELPDDEIEQLNVLIKATMRQLLILTNEGKGTALKAMQNTLKDHHARLEYLKAERLRQQEQESPEEHHNAILAYVKELGADDPLRIELRSLLCGKK